MENSWADLWFYTNLVFVDLATPWPPTWTADPGSPVQVGPREPERV